MVISAGPSTGGGQTDRLTDLQLIYKILLAKKPLKKLSLYELDPEDIYINMDEVNEWSKDNQKIYEDYAYQNFGFL